MSAIAFSSTIVILLPTAVKFDAMEDLYHISATNINDLE